MPRARGFDPILIMPRARGFEYWFGGIDINTTPEEETYSWLFTSEVPDVAEGSGGNGNHPTCEVEKKRHEE
jgi:hypothetical protein